MIPKIKTKYKNAILKTLAYSSVFKYPLTFHQLSTYLISKNNEQDYDSFVSELNDLVRTRRVKVKDRRYILPETKYIDAKKRKRETDTLIERNLRVFKILKTIPWIKFIGITGSTAAGNTTKDSDIDVLIVTSKNRLWITRGFIAVILRDILKNYVYKGVDPNIYLDETSLKWPEEKQNIYIANDLIRIIPMVDKNYTYFKFLRANKWALEYFPNFNICIEHKPKFKTFDNTNPLMNFLDNVAMKIQLKYMAKKKTHEITEKHHIHFNVNDSTRKVLTLLTRKINQIKSS